MDDAFDAHGRTLSTSPAAAAWYREAQRTAHEPDDPRRPLREAVTADPTFAVAAADLDALTGEAAVCPVSRPVTTWERHHQEIVATATSGQASRALALLREHLAEVGCDPLAARIVADHTEPRPDPADLSTPHPCECWMRDGAHAPSGAEVRGGRVAQP
jgi:hypothetical protein